MVGIAGVCSGLLVGVVLTLIIVSNWAERNGDDFEDEAAPNPDHEGAHAAFEVQRAALLKAHEALAKQAERAAADRVGDAQKIANTMENAANVLLKAAHTERAAADALTAATAQMARLEERFGLLQSVSESIDSQQGGILTALINSGMMQQTDLRRSNMRQHGEHDPDNPPPLVERDRGKPLDEIIR